MKAVKLLASLPIIAFFIGAAMFLVMSMGAAAVDRPAWASIGRFISMYLLAGIMVYAMFHVLSWVWRKK